MGLTKRQQVERALRRFKEMEGQEDPILVGRRRQLQAWVAKHMAQCEEAHRLLDGLGVPRYEGSRILTLRERIQRVVNASDDMQGGAIGGSNGR